MNGNSTVNALDAALVSSASGKSIAANTFRCDVNGNGVVNSLDTALVTQRSGNSLP